MNGFVRGVCALVGIWSIYLSYYLFSRGEIVFRGSFYSFDSTPLMFPASIGGAFIVGVYLIYNAIVGDSDTDSDG